MGVLEQPLTLLAFSNRAPPEVQESAWKLLEAFFPSGVSVQEVMNSGLRGSQLSNPVLDLIVKALKSMVSINSLEELVAEHKALDGKVCIFSSSSCWIPKSDML